MIHLRFGRLVFEELCGTAPGRDRNHGTVSELAAPDPHGGTRSDDGCSVLRTGELLTAHGVVFHGASHSSLQPSIMAMHCSVSLATKPVEMPNSGPSPKHLEKELRSMLVAV